jgi:hypothetical protein
MKFNIFNNIGFFLLAVFLILHGLVILVPAIAIPIVFFGVLALVTGIFILIGK